MKRGSHVVVLSFLCAGLSFAQQDVLTANYDNARTNSDTKETILRPSGVSPANFGKLFALSVDGQVYAQPLYRQNLAIPGKGTHNAVFVATMHNTVYCFDADTPAPPLWSVNLGPAVPAGSYDSDIGPYTDIAPENGILSTPVIDAATGTIYVVAATLENGNYLYKLHALDTASGAEKFGAPSIIAAQVPGVGDSSANGIVPFVAAQHIQRPGLLLLKGVVYISFGSHGDAAPYHGWLLGYSAADVRKQVSVFNPTPNGAGGAFWQSGRGLTADDQGNIFAVSSNGSDADTENFSDNVLRMNADATGVADFFSPFNIQDLNDGDEDLGSAGAMLIPGTNFLMTGGKQGVIYLLDKTNLGRSNANDGQIPQSLNMGDFGIFNMALWNRPDGPLLYTHIANAPVVAYRLAGNRLTTAPVFQAAGGFNVPFQGMTLSANGTQPGTGILWVTQPVTYPLPSHGVLHAYNADDLTELWNSDMTPGDTLGGFVKFANPTVANGKVYVPTMDNQLVIYGPAPTNLGTAPQFPVVTAIVNAGSYANGPVAPGEIVAVFGQNLGPQQLTVGSIDDRGQMQTSVAGTQVTFNGILAPVLYSNAGSLGVIVPYEIAGSDQVTFQVSYNGQASDAQNLAVADAAPGLFAADASGSGPGAVLNGDYSLNTPDRPAAPGDIVVIYATGGGQTNPPSTTGSLTMAAAPQLKDVSVTLGGKPAKVLYAGNAGGEVAGAMQLNVRVPQGLTGALPVVITSAGQSSQATVTVSVR